MSSKGPGQLDQVKDNSSRPMRKFSVPPVPSLEKDVDSIRVPGISDLTLGNLMRDAWNNWVRKVCERYPSARPVLRTFISQEELSVIVSGIREDASAYIRSDSAMAHYSENDPELAREVEEKIRERVSLKIKAALAKVSARIESQSDPQTRLLTGPVADKHIENLIIRDRIPSAIFSCDVRGLGDLNTALGPLLTDHVIKALFERFSKNLRETDVFTMFRRQAGGDEGIGILPGVTTLEEAGVVIKKLFDVLAEDITLSLTTQEAREILNTYIRHKTKINKGEKLVKKFLVPFLSLKTLFFNYQRLYRNKGPSETLKFLLN